MQRAAGRLVGVFALFSLATAALGGCDEEGRRSVGTSNSIVLGEVVDREGSPLADVSVELASRETQTNDQGWYSLGNVTPGSRRVVSFRKEGFAPTHRVLEVPSGTSTFGDTTLVRYETVTTLDAGTGGQVTAPSGASFELPGNALVDPSGQPVEGDVDVGIVGFDPTVSEDLDAFPGRFRGTTGQGETVPLETFGFMTVEVRQDGERLRLADDATGQARIPAANRGGDPPETMPLWYFDPDEGRWREQGEVSLGDDETFQTEVDQLGTWNADLPYETSTLTGRVVTEQGEPVADAQVIHEGVDYSGRTTVLSDDDGRFELPVRQDSRVRLWAQKGAVFSATTEYDTLPTGEIKDVGDVTMNGEPLVQVTLTWGETPADLDTHLRGPTGDGRFHVSFLSMGSLGSEPFANLDTDDTNSFGPEITTVTRLRPGRYVYCVHNYTGEGTAPMAESGAQVRFLDLQSARQRTLDIPTSNPEGHNVWRVLEFRVDDGGTIQNVELVDGYESTSDPGSVCAPAGSP